MINENLPHGELVTGLEDYLDRIDYILGELGVGAGTSIVNNRKLLGRMHHAINISNYGKPEFMETLLRRAGMQRLEAFFHRTGIAASLDASADVGVLVRRAARLPWGNNDYTRAFVDIFGYEDGLVPEETGDIPAYEKCRPYGEPLKTLKEYQSGIFFKSMNLVQIPWSRFVIKMPTGSGKTRTAMEVLCHFLRDGSGTGFRQALWIADRDELCEQAVESIKHVWPHIGGQALNIYRLWGSRRHEKFDDSSFIVATYQTLHSMLRKNVLNLEPDLIVTDEAHNVLAPTHRRILDRLVRKKTRIMGLTATPLRSDDRESRGLVAFFNEQILEIDSGDTNPIKYLQGQGYLSHCNPVTIPSRREYRLTPEERREIERERDLPPGLLDKIARDDRRNFIIAECLKRLHEEGRQVLYFAPSIEQSKFMCMIMMAIGSRAAHIDGNTPSPYRRDTIAKFRRGAIKMIFNFGVFSTGFDAPNIDVVFIARPTKSLVLHQQMIGRGMRGPAMGGTRQFFLYRIVDNMPEIDLADEYFTDIWKYYDEYG